MMQTLRLCTGRRIFAALLLVATAGCMHEETKSFRGVTEGEIIRLKAPVAGNLSSMEVTRGAMVAEGAKLFSQADAGEISAHAEAARRLERIEGAQRKRDGAESEEVESLKAEVAEAEWKVMLKSAAAPVGGVVTETLYSKGDWVPAGAPVLSILPVDKIKVTFEVPLAVAAHLQHGRNVTLLCEKCESPVQATITYVAPFATPESSVGETHELHYRVEARPIPSQAALLHPGQAITVNL